MSNVQRLMYRSNARRITSETVSPCFAAFFNAASHKASSTRTLRDGVLGALGTTHHLKGRGVSNTSTFTALDVAVVAFKVNDNAFTSARFKTIPFRKVSAFSNTHPTVVCEVHTVHFSPTHYKVSPQVDKFNGSQVIVASGDFSNTVLIGYPFVVNEVVEVAVIPTSTSSHDNGGVAQVDPQSTGVLNRGLNTVLVKSVLDCFKHFFVSVCRVHLGFLSRQESARLAAVTHVVFHKDCASVNDWKHALALRAYPRCVWSLGFVVAHFGSPFHQLPVGVGTPSHGVSTPVKPIEELSLGVSINRSRKEAA